MSTMVDPGEGETAGVAQPVTEESSPETPILSAEPLEHGVEDRAPAPWRLSTIYC